VCARVGGVSVGGAGVRGGGPHPPFGPALSSGPAGERVARTLHARTGWFPRRREIGLTREEDGRGGYRLVSTTGEPLAEQLMGVETAGSLAVVDDTIFSGLTLGGVLRALPSAPLPRTHAFCLRGRAASAPAGAHMCPVTV